MSMHLNCKHDTLALAVRASSPEVGSSVNNTGELDVARGRRPERHTDDKNGGI